VFHAAFEYLLIAVLVAAVVSFVVMGLAKMRRSRWLARAAHQRGNRFFRDDPFDVPRRYAHFALISSGHSPCANNVTDGRLGGRSARAFDFRCELGHGTRRITRHYSVLVVGAADCPQRLLMWSDADAEGAPLVARDAQGHVGGWACTGPADLAALAERACPGLAESGTSIELRDGLLMLAAPARQSPLAYAVDLDCALALVAGLTGQSPVASRR
jgi:hypothetical protein